MSLNKSKNPCLLQAVHHMHFYPLGSVMFYSHHYPFETSLEKLEKLVEQMEDGDLTLEDSLKTFEEGIRLTRECQQALAAAEQKVKLLIEENGQVTASDFEAGD